jgi:hypothetical protein
LVGSSNARVEVVLNLLVYEGDDLLAEGLSVALSLHFHVEQLFLANTYLLLVNELLGHWRHQLQRVHAVKEGLVVHLLLFEQGLDRLVLLGKLLVISAREGQ